MMTNIHDFVDTWGIYSLYSTSDPEDHPDVHPDDFSEFAAKNPGNQVLHCVGVEDEYLILKYHTCYDISHYRVKPGLYYRMVPPPPFTVGEQVVDPNHRDQEAVVCSIGWHYKRAEHMFSITLDGKLRSKRYYAEDLEPIK